MLIAHLPAGYVLGTAVRGVRRSAYAVMSAALFGSVAPDLDMFYFYTLGARQAHHHFYVTHWPLFWLALGVIVVPVVKWLRPQLTVASVVFLVAVMIHMVLDSIAAPMAWLMPFNSRTVELVTIPAAYSHWILSFVLHWTFALELAICALAALLVARNARRRRLQESGA